MTSFSPLFLFGSQDASMQNEFFELNFNCNNTILVLPCHIYSRNVTSPMVESVLADVTQNMALKVSVNELRVKVSGGIVRTCQACERGGWR